MMKCKVIHLAAVVVVLAASAVYSAELKKPVDGYSGVKWGASIADVRKSAKGKIIFDDDKKLVMTKDGEITYRYGFVFSEKVPVKQDAQTNPTQQPQTPQGQTPQGQQTAQGQTQNQTATQTDATEGESKFFYVVIEFPYLALDDVRKKVTAEYGEPTGDTVTKGQGALVWDSGDGIVIVWVDSYEKKPYCRRISYISKSIAKELSQNQLNIFSRKELDVLKNLNP